MSEENKRNHEMTEGPLLDEQGRLAECGYAKRLVKQYDRNAIKARGSRIKEWDYYYVGNDEFGVALTIDDNSYMGLVGASFLDFTEAKETTVNVITPFTGGKTKLPPTSVKGNVGVKGKRVIAEFLNDGSERTLRFLVKKFNADGDLFVDVTLREPEGGESMVIATPFPGNDKAFYYNQKIIGMNALGKVKIGNREYRIEPGSSLGLLDWGRGVWTYKNTWYWGAGQGFVDGHVFGFNIGYGFGDTTAASENMIFYDGKAHKLDDVTFNIPKDEKGRDLFTDKWTFTSSDGRFEMDFVPIIDRANCTNALIIKSDQHQVFGRFTGKAVLDDGKVIEIKDFLGFAEKVYNKW